MLLSLTAAVLLAQAAPVLTLDEAYRLAESQNKDLQVARARLEQTDLLSRRAWGGYLPQLSVNGTYAWNSATAKIALPTGFAIRDLGIVPPNQPEGLPGAPTTLIQVPTSIIEAVIQPEHSLTGTLQLSQAVIVPQLWFAIGNANLAEKAATLSVENARREILFATAQIYYGAEGLRQALEVQQRLLDVNLAREKDAEVRFNAGTATKVALLRAQIERARAEQDVQRTRNSYRGLKVALATLMGRSDANFEVAAPTAPGELSAVEELMRRQIRGRISSPHARTSSSPRDNAARCGPATPPPSAPSPA